MGTMKIQKQLPLQIQHVPPDNKPMKTEISLSPEHLEVEHYYLPIFNGAKTKRANDEECTFKTMKSEISLSPEHLEVEHYYLPTFKGAKTKRVKKKRAKKKRRKMQQKKKNVVKRQNKNPSNVVNTRNGRFGVKILFRGFPLRIGSAYCTAEDASKVATVFRKSAQIDPHTGSICFTENFFGKKNTKIFM